MNISNTFARNRTLGLIVGISLGLHVLALVIFGAFKVVESIVREEQTFEAPEIIEVPQQEPEYVVNLEQRNQSSAPPRPNPIMVESPDVSIPALDIDVNIADSSAYGRGAGGLGTGAMEMREMVLGEINFFGASASGGNIVILFDCTWSAREVFKETRRELFRTLDSMSEMGAGQFALIYFGGRVGGGQLAVESDEDPTKHDYWFTRGVAEGQWLSPGSDQEKRIRRELGKVKADELSSKVEFAKQLRNSDDGFFVLGTQYWGAMNAAFKMDPSPDTVFFLVEANIAFPDVQTVKKSYARFEKHGMRKPPETSVHFIVGNKESNVKSKEALHLMVNLVNGGNLSDSKIRGLITYTQ